MKDDIANATTLESKPCGRCQGTGSLPHFGHVHGGVCFRCAGQKVVYTKRGAAARAFLTASRSKPCEQVVPGEKIQACFGDPNHQFYAFATVTESKQSGTQQISNGQPFFYWVLNVSHPKFGAVDSYFLPRTSCRVAQSAEAKIATFKAALAFQATLTKSGTPRAVKP